MPAGGRGRVFRRIVVVVPAGNANLLQQNGNAGIRDGSESDETVRKVRPARAGKISSHKDLSAITLLNVVQNVGLSTTLNEG